MMGSIEAMHERDRHLISRWAARLSGQIVDAGCGPGHWTDFLDKHGSNVRRSRAGVHRTGEGAVSGLPFRVAPFDALDLPVGRAVGILTWYSVIHLEPERVPVVLDEFARSLEPDGRLLLGFFEGARLQPFSHAVTTAYFWPVDEMTRLVGDAGFLVEEVHTRADPNTRPHAAIVARRVGADPASVPAY